MWKQWNSTELRFSSVEFEAEAFRPVKTRYRWVCSPRRFPQLPHSNLSPALPALPSGASWQPLIMNRVLTYLSADGGKPSV